MDIRDWPLDQIMQLPDCCFGRRWPVACERLTDSGNEEFDISEIALPELCVIWSVSLDWYNVESRIAHCKLALGDQLPTTAAQMAANEALLRGVGIQGAEPRDIRLWIGSFTVLWNMRTPIAAMGRRLVMEILGDPLVLINVRVVVEVSSIPTEVPDCLVSEYLRSR